MPATLSLAQQERLIRMRYPKAKTSYHWLQGEKVLWTDLTLQAAPVYDRYRVMIGYMLDGPQPAVYVVAPKPVKDAHGIRTPHLNRDGTLCLYDPTKEQWADSDALAYTTIPWTLRWLFHYENWLSSSVWLGDTNPPVIKDESAMTVTALEKPS